MDKFIFLDTETTGNSEEDKICQLCFLVDDGSLVGYEAHNTLCDPKIQIKIDAMTTHHITPEMVEGKPELKETQVFKNLQKLNIPENTVIIHNAPFDLGMLAKEGFESKMKLIDTIRCLKHLYPEQKAALQYVRYALGLYKNEPKNVQAHDAFGDVIVLRLLVQHLLKHPKVKDDFDFLVYLTQKQIVYKNFTFGKHEGRVIEEVVIEDPEYCQYLVDTSEDQDLKDTLKHLLKKHQDNLIYRFNVGKYKGKSIEDIVKIGDFDYLNWAYKNMDKISKDFRDAIKTCLDNSKQN